MLLARVLSIGLGGLALCGGLAWLLDHAAALLFASPEGAGALRRGDTAAA